MQAFLKLVTTIFIVSFYICFLQAYPEEKINFATPKKNSSDKIVATINNTPIYLSEFEKKYDYATRSQPFSKKISKKEFLDHLIKFELVIQKAFAQKIHETEFAREAFRQTLNQLLYAQDLAPELNKVSVSTLGDRELQRFFKEKGFKKLSQIVIRISYEDEHKEKRRSVAEVENKARNIHKELVKNPSLFSELAKRHSEGPEAPLGGDIGYKTLMDLPPEIAQVVSHMKRQGEISAPIKTLIGYHILKLSENPARLSSLAAQDLKLFKEKAVFFKQIEVSNLYYQNLLKKASVNINSQYLQAP